MTRESPNVRPPRIAVWLVGLLTPASYAESILGDLYEEFFDLAARSGVAVARRWFWRQSRKTAANLVAAQVLAAPWSLVGAVMLGFLLRRVGLSNPAGIVVMILQTQKPYSNLHYDFYVWMMNWGIPIVGVIQSLAVGCVVAAVARGREILAALAMTALSMVLVAVSFSRLLHQLPSNVPAPWPLLALNFQSWIAIVIGGILVRRIRSLSSRHLSTP
jgi:hypothetical protein